MLTDINNTMGYSLSENQLFALGKEAYANLLDELEAMFSNLRDLRMFNDKYVYPSEITNIKRNTIFISAPMSSINATEYNQLRELILKIKTSLLKLDFTEVYCSLFDIDSPDHFDGKAKAIKSNFPLMKQVDSMLIVYPWKNASSSLVEMGYGIALTKRMVVFYREGLPYIMEEAGNSITNVKTYSFDSCDEIISIIDSNGMALFEGVSDE